MIKVFFELNLGSRLKEHALLLEANINRYRSHIGAYKGVESPSYSVVVPKLNASLIELFRACKQESVLVVDNNNKAKLIYLKDLREEHIGTYKKVTKKEALKSDAYTMDLLNFNYYMVK